VKPRAIVPINVTEEQVRALAWAMDHVFGPVPTPIAEDDTAEMCDRCGGDQDSCKHQQIIR